MHSSIYFFQKLINYLFICSIIIIFLLLYVLSQLFPVCFHFEYIARPSHIVVFILVCLWMVDEDSVQFLIVCKFPCRWNRLSGRAVSRCRPNVCILLKEHATSSDLILVHIYAKYTSFCLVKFRCYN